MTQQEFDELMRANKRKYTLTQQSLMAQMVENKKAQKLQREKMRAIYVVDEPASKETKAKNETYSLQRHLKHEIVRFCDGKVGLTSEGAEVQFAADDAQVVFTIVVPKK